MKEIPTRYDHHQEPETYQKWLSAGLFKPTGKGEPFCMVLPPPNVTGDLHMGHALTYNIEDVIGRNRRRRGFDVLLLPGADHAAIAVQALVEKKLQKEGLNRREIGREKFLEKVWEWIRYYQPRNQESLQRFGLSAQWDRYRFTMDEPSQRSVRKAFVRLYEQGLIYRGQYLVNWDPKLQTAISDDEVLYQEVPGKLYWIKYGPISVATTRPETKLGDTAIAVNPNDHRYRQFVGQEIEFTNEQGQIQKLPVIADEAVDPEFGTGALKVTPAHDHTDYQLGQKHHLPMKSVINQYGKMAESTGPYAGLKREEARERIVADLEKQGLIEKITDYTIRQPISERSNAVVEPLLSTQWFMKTTALKEQAIKVVATKQIEFIPAHIEKTYFHWIENLHDWCISRQLWWGHQIPAWYDEQGKIYVAESLTEAQQLSGKKDLKQDEDVLDTWFSSGIWPLTTLGWPDPTKDFQHYFPTQLMETGADILFFWVSRMILMSLALTERVPFHQVYFHGLVLDESGQKMSKSKGNVLDPLQLIELHGADALRMSLIGGTSTGGNQRFSEQKILKYRNFVTKIWNAARFIAMTTEGAKNQLPTTLDQSEKQFFERLTQIEKDNEKLFDDYNLGLALEELYEFFWHEFADKFLEYEKKAISESKDSKREKQAKQALKSAMSRLMVLLSDFAPFLIDAINSEMGL